MPAREVTVQLTKALARDLAKMATELEEDPAELVRCALATWLAKPVMVLDQWTPSGVQVLE